VVAGDVLDVEVEGLGAFLRATLCDVPHAASVSVTAEKQRRDPAALNRLAMRRPISSPPVAVNRERTQDEYRRIIEAVHVRTYRSVVQFPLGLPEKSNLNIAHG